MTIEISSPGFGNIGNKIIQYMVCKELSNKINGSVICDICIDEFEITSQKSRINNDENVIVIGDNMEIPFDILSEYLSLNKDVKILLNGFFQKIEYYPSVDDCRRIFASDIVLNHQFSDDEVVINIRCGELTSGQVSWYPILPVAFYKHIVDTTGLKPVFVGQLDNVLYVEEIKKVFPKARYIPSRGALYDFQLIRSAKNIAISVSTFSWLAAWLSHAENIFYPLAGFLNPALQKAYNQVELFTDFAPTSDERFRFFQMPFFYNEEISSLIQHHASFYEKIYEVPPKYVDKLKNSPFIKRNTLPNRLCFRDRLDALWYLKKYPIAAREISEGYYSSPSHHYEEIGWMRNYSPFPINNIPRDSVLISNFCKATQSSVDISWSHGKTLKSDASTLIKEYNSPEIFNHTELQKNAWWCVDLGKNWDVTCISIQNRTDNLGVENRLFPFFIESSEDGKNFIKISSFNKNIYHTHGVLVSIFNQPIRARFVRIFLPGEDRLLSICQVRIYANKNS